MKLSALRILLPLGVMLLFLLALAITLLLALGEQRTLLLSQARHDIQREVNHYTWQAERVLAIDPQLLEDDLSQLATDPRVDMALVISPQGLVMASSQYVLRGRQVTEVLEDFSAQRFAQVAADRDAFISFDDSRDTLTAIMSYTAPAAGDALRSLDKGVVYIRYNLSRALVEARHQALQQRIPELFALLLIALLLAQFLRRHVTSPLGRVQEAARAMAAGDFDFTRHITPNGPEEIRELTVAFNLMSARLAEQLAKLDKQSRHTQAVVDNVIDAIITIDGRGHIASANRATERIFGYTLDEMLGNNVKMLMPEPYRSQHDGFLANYQATGIARIIGIGREVVGRRKDGSEFPMELAVSEIDYQGQPLFIGVIRDITERKRMEQMKSEFVSTVSHELRTPLTSIGGSLGLLAGGAAGELSPQASQLIQLANNNTKRLTLLINDLLDMEKIAAGKLHFDMRELDLSPLVQQALDENQGYADQNQVSFVL